jgi:hypothetical protein
VFFDRPRPAPVAIDLRADEERAMPAARVATRQ